MFRTLLRRILRRPELKKKLDPAICPACGEHIPHCRRGGKAQHFMERHPEYPFKIERPYRYDMPQIGTLESSQIRYVCLVCDKTFCSFKNLVEKHRHEEVPAPIETVSATK